MNVEENLIKNVSSEEERRIQEMKQEDKRTKKKFTVICLIAGFIGGIAGMLLVKGLSMFDNWEEAFPVFWAQFQVNSILFFRILLILEGVGMCTYTTIKCRIAEKLWKDREHREENWERTEKKIEAVIALSSIHQILQCILFAASSYAIHKTVKVYPASFLISSFGYLFFIFWGLGIAKKAINLIKEMNPNKKASIYDMKFNQKWYESCDEAERMQIGISSYKAFRAATYSCMIIIMLLTIVCTMLELGLLPVLCVGIVWLIQTIVYQYYARKAEKMLQESVK